MSTFQLVTMLVFGSAAVIATGVFALGSFGDDSRNLVVLELWGSMDKALVDTWLMENFEGNPDLKVNYRYISKGRFDEQLLESMSMGRGPDMAIMTQDQIQRHRQRIVGIPFTYFSEREFRDTFTQSTEVFMNRKGGFIYGMPILVDPLVMYWNRSLIRPSGYPRPPVRWSEFSDFVLDNVKQERRNILISAVALGEYRNVDNAKAILSTLIFQAGGKIIDGTSGDFKVLFSDRFGQSIRPAESALLFYTDFSDPRRLFYTWNRQLPGSFRSFANEKLVVYFGMASDLKRLKEVNPFLDIDLAIVPENEKGVSASYSNVTGVVIMRSTKNFPASFNAISQMTSNGSLRRLSGHLQGVPPSRNDLLFNPGREQDFLAPVFYEAARKSFGWMDPFPNQTEMILLEAVEAIVDRESEVSDVIHRTQRRLRSLVRGL